MQLCARHSAHDSGGVIRASALSFRPPFTLALGRRQPHIVTQPLDREEAEVWWLLVCTFLGVPFLIGVVAQTKKRRHPPLERSTEPDDFLSDDHPHFPYSNWR